MAKDAEEKIVMSRSGWARSQVLQNPEITLEQLQKAYDKTKFLKKDRPTSEQALHQARSQLRGRWETPLEELPRKPNGELNVRGFFFLCFKKGHTTHDASRKYMGADGIEVSKSSYDNAHADYIKEFGDVEESRAGTPGKRKYVRRGGKGKRSKRVVETTTFQEYERIESQLDGLMAKAEALKDGKLAAVLKQARRRAGAFIVSHQ